LTDCSVYIAARNGDILKVQQMISEKQAIVTNRIRWDNGTALHVSHSKSSADLISGTGNIKYIDYYFPIALTLLLSTHIMSKNLSLLLPPFLQE
jgi:hypothetical protein